jgi:hypothetical protein
LPFVLAKTAVLRDRRVYAGSHLEVRNAFMPFFTEDVQKGLVAGAFGLAGTLIPVTLSWSRDRDMASARLRKLEEATKRVAFWDQWYKLSTQIKNPSDSESLETVQRELTLLRDIIEGDALLAHAQLSKQQSKTSEFTGKVQALPFWRKLLLLYRPARSLAWFPRILFYVGVVSFLIFVLVHISEKGNLEGFLLIELMTLVWMLVFRYLSRWLEEPHGALLTVPSSIPPPLKPQ